jgi:hypothetical protein
MTTPDYEDVKRSLLHVANVFAPDAGVQRAFTELVHSLELTQSSQKDVALALTGRIYDGLAYGNWPKPKQNRRPVSAQV